MNKYKTRSIKYILYGLLLTGVFFSCSKDYGTDDHTDNLANVYISQALGLSEDLTVTYSSTPSVLTLSASTGKKSGADIKATFAVDNSLVASFNTTNKTTYATLPAGSYSIPAPTVTIPTGSTVSGNVQIKLNTSGVLDRSTTYLLPVVLTTVDGGTINPNMKVKYLTVKAVYQDLSKTGWTILGFDSQEATGEGPNNGRAVFVLDNDNSTFWHTQWDGGSPPLPHWVSIDMASPKLISGLSFVNRPGKTDGVPKDIKVETSTDGTTWTSQGNYVIVQGDPKQYIYFAAPVTARYFKITITTSYGNTSFIFMSEIGAI